MGVDARGFPGGLLRLDPAYAFWCMACCSELSKGMCILGETSRDDVLTQRHTPVLVELQMQRSVGLSPQILAGGRLYCLLEFAQIHIL